jgi:hypothetical protein
VLDRQRGEQRGSGAVWGDARKRVLIQSVSAGLSNFPSIFCARGLRLVRVPQEGDVLRW